MRRERSTPLAAQCACYHPAEAVAPTLPIETAPSAQQRGGAGKIPAEPLAVLTTGPASSIRIGPARGYKIHEATHPSGIGLRAPIFPLFHALLHDDTAPLSLLTVKILHSNNLVQYKCILHFQYIRPMLSMSRDIKP